MTLKELAAARQAELDAGKASRDKAKAEGRDLTDDELTTVEGHIQKADEHQAAFDAARKRATVLAALDDADAASRQPLPQPNATPR